MPGKERAQDARGRVAERAGNDAFRRSDAESRPGRPGEAKSDRRLNWQQACQLLGCSKTHFYRLVNSGELPSERFGVVKGVTVKEADCREYLCKWKERVGEDVSVD